ncbi:MAG: nucleotidyltransferase family protein, partial [Peptostreptococcaceae bacterium]
MITTQKHLITYLKAAIHNRKLSASSLSTSALNQLFLEAKDHSIQGLIYSAISDISSLQDISPDIINTWKKETFLTGMTQNNHITQMSKVFLKFNQESIPVIALKGLTLRDLYPKPDLRSMSDAD